METNLKPLKKCSSRILNNTWWIDKNNRVWVVTGVWYTAEQTVELALLQRGKSEVNMQPYEVVENEVACGRMVQIFE